ncbi:quinon protein alcohol dehydrogenase-like superfamily [Mycena sp. CBHHK59/15]|nr:quinon protein alcohol dehydrogenase-like superfamily [Mycena sp. CBHHK59/15]
MLDKLLPVPGSCYEDIGGSECMPGTRVGVLAELMAWATDPDSPPIYLLTGMAGAGKSAIARSFARLLHGQMFLGASFFCSRASETRSNVAGIIPSIAFHLALHSPPYAQAVIDAIKKAPGVSFNLRTPDFQFGTLIMDPSPSLSQESQIPVIIIDALDECSSFNAVRDLLRVLIRSSNGVRVKFFITSRPEPHIETAFKPEVVARRLRLRDVEHDIVAADIEKYLRKNLAHVARRINSPGWPSDTEMKNLIHRTGQLFIFAFTAVQYLSAEYLSHNEIQKRLHNILSASSATKIQTAQIDTLYGQIVDAAWNGKEPGEITDRQNALSTIICLREPLSLSAISRVREEDPENLKLVLADFHSVIDIPSSLESPVIIFHASFPDYMTDRHRSGHNRLDTQAHHVVLALRCIKCMNLMLHQNLCGIKRADSNTLIAENVVNRSIPAYLRYASIHWGTHLSLVPLGAVDSTLISELAILSKTHILHWLECLSLLGKLHIAVDCLQAAILFTSRQNCPEIRNLMDEVRRMIPQIFKFASVYPLEVYHSALEWLPTRSQIRKTYHTNKSQCVYGLQHQWDICEQVLAQSGGCNSVAFSLDGVYLVSACNDNKATVWRVGTGQMQRELLGHSELVRSVAFSPDGAHIVSGSNDKTIRIWNVETGETVRELAGHSDFVCSVAFSPDGVRIASGSVNRTIRIWNVKTGEMERELAGHSDFVCSVAFSPDGVRIASGSADRTIRIWNVKNGETERELAGHSDVVNSVAFSPDGAHVASGSDDHIIRIWNIETGETERELAGHSNWVRSVAFSPDGAHIASGSDDNTVRIWNVETREMERELAGHSSWVYSVAFSPDGAHIASGSVDKTIRIWNVETGETERELAGHSNQVRSVAFSPDGAHIASGSADETVRIWNVETGETVRELAGHSSWVYSVAFSPDGAHIASGSADNTVRIWNVETGETEWELVGHSNRVRSVAFSPDGAHIASGSADDTVRIWNVETGETEWELAGHSGWVHSVAFSPDGAHIASGSNDTTIRIWNIETGETEQELAGHPDRVHSVAFSLDGAHIASGSDDEIMRIWNVATGDLEEELEEVAPDWCTSPETIFHLPESDRAICKLARDGDGGEHLLLHSQSEAIHNRLWIWSDYRHDVTCSTFQGTRACIGYGSGHVVFVDLAQW